MDWSIWGTKLAGSLRSLAVRLAKLMISESGSARQVRQGNQSGDRARKQKQVGGCSKTRSGDGCRQATSRVPGEGVPVALPVHLEVDAYRHQVVPRRPAARRSRRGTNQPPHPLFLRSNRSEGPSLMEEDLGEGGGRTCGS